VWQLYFGLIFIAVVLFAPGGITGLLMMHRPLLKAGTLPKVLPSYLIALVPTLAMITGLALAIETIVHYTVNPGDDSHIKAFGVPFDAASPYIWAMSGILLFGGFLVARKTWTWVGYAWDSATSAAREKGIAT
jgi:branched-chain amino acid transport system permease protein